MRHIAPLIALAFALPACMPVDEDGDGVPASLDCDDGDYNVFPGANEICDGKDNDCNGVADDDYAKGGQIFFLDRDGDGYGVWEQAKVQCTAPEGYVDNADDCADDDENTFPGAPEFCDKIDQNCNDIIDEDAVDAVAYYADFDQDGYGGEDQAVFECEQPEGFILQGGDCNDFDPYKNPEAIERCNLEDDNCNGTIDEGESLDAVTWYADNDRDGYGGFDDTIQSCYQPEYYEPEELAGDCNDADPLINPGAKEICNDGVDNNCNETADQCDPFGWDDLDQAAVVFQGSGSSAYFGRDVTIVGDMNGDGYDEFAVGGYRANNPVCSGAGSSYCGSVSLHYGASDIGDPQLSITPTDGVHYGNKQRYMYLGVSVAGIGDINGDGYADLAMGAYGNNYGASYSGAVYVEYGRASMPAAPTDVDVDAKLAMLYGGTSSSRYLGYNVSPAGDVDGDGYDDFTIAAPREDGVSSYAGKVYMVYGSSTKLTFGPAADHPALMGENTYDYLGGYGYQGSMGHGDFDGDGLSDMMIGTKDFDFAGNYSTGRVYMVYGSGERITGDVPVADQASATVTGSGSYNYVSTSANGVGDVNADGYEDMVVCGYGVSSYQGRCALAWGGADRMEGDTKFGSFGAASWVGEQSYDYMGQYGVAGADIDQDGFSDIIFGAPYAEPQGSTIYSPGAVYLVRGGPDLEGQKSVASDITTIMGDVRYMYVSNGVSQETGDINGDGYPDLGFGAYGAYSYAGGAWFFVGGGM